MSARAKQSSATSRRTRTHIGPWQLGRTLGRGSSGRVRLAKHADTGQLAAVKIVPKTMVESTYGIEREVIIMKLIEHPNIMGLYDVWENKGELYLVLEYIEGGELFDYLVRRGRLNEREAVFYFRQICLGVQYCHQFNICHRDLKPENLLLDRHRNIKIADFGMAALETQDRMLETSCGSPHYASPEIVAGRTYHGAPSDIWSCGVILFALVTGHLPFDDDNIRVLLRKVQAGRFSIPSFVGPEARDLIAKMLKVEPKDRITMDQIFKHPLLNKYHFRHQQPVPAPPTLDATHPVSSIEEIDQEILRNLKTLWHHSKEETIIKQLLDPAPNPEKTFYCLLLKYRQSHRKPQPKASSSPINRSSSRNSIKSTRSKRSSSSRSLRAIPRQSRVSMASVHSKYVAERPAPKAPARQSVYDPEDVTLEDLKDVKRHSQVQQVQQQQQQKPQQPITSTPIKQQQQPAQGQKQVPQGPHAPSTIQPPRLGEQPQQHHQDSIQSPSRPTRASAVASPTSPAKAATHSSFAELIDKAFAQRSASASEPKPLVIDERRTVSDGELLPMIFEEDRFADAPDTYKVRRKPVGDPSSRPTSTASSIFYSPMGPPTGSSTPGIGGSGATPTTAPQSGQSAPSTGGGGSAKTGPVLRPHSMIDPTRSELSVVRREKRTSAATVPRTKPTEAAPPTPQLPMSSAAAARSSPNVELERKPTKKLAEFAASTPALSSPKVGSNERKPLSGVPANVYPPLATEQKQKVSILRRFTPKRQKTTPATVTSEDVRPSSNTSQPEETKQNWLFKMLNLGTQGGPQKTLLSTAKVSHLRSVIVEVLEEWSKYGLVFEGSGNTITATISSKNAFKLRMSRFTIRVQSLNPGSSSAVCTQVRGAQLSYLRFVGELERVLGDKNLLGPPDINVL